MIFEGLSDNTHANPKNNIVNMINETGPASFDKKGFTLLSLNPSKIIDIVGKFLTPIKLTFIGLLVVVALIRPIGTIQAPSKGYTSQAFFKGFQEGYLTRVRYPS